MYDYYLDCGCGWEGSESDVDPTFSGPHGGGEISVLWSCPECGKEHSDRRYTDEIERLL